MAQQSQFFILYPPSKERPLGSWGSVSRERAENAEKEGAIGYFGPQPPDLSQIIEISGGWDQEHRTTTGDVFDITTQLADEGDFVSGQFEGEGTWSDRTYGGRDEVMSGWQGGYNMPDPPSEDTLPEGWMQEEDQWGQKKYIVDHYTNQWTPNGFFGSGQPPQVTSGTQDPGLGPVGGGPEPGESPYSPHWPDLQPGQSTNINPITGEYDPNQTWSIPGAAGSSPGAAPAIGDTLWRGGDGLTNAEGEESAKGALTRLIKLYGLDMKLVEFLSDEIIEGTSDTGIIQKLRERPEYKARFPGMALRAANDFNAINETTYLDLEDDYRTALKAAKLPATFYDQADDFAKLIGGDVAAPEFQRRVNLAYQAAGGADSETVNQLESLYGVTRDQLTAIYLDPTSAKSIIQQEREMRTAQMSAGVVRSLGSGLSKSAAEKLEKAAVRVSDMAKLAGSRGLTSRLLNENSLSTDQIALGSMGMDSTANQEIESVVENRRSRLGGRSGLYGDQGGFAGFGTTGT